MKKRIIAIIDYEEEFKDEFSRTLEDLGLSDKYELRLVKFTSRMPTEQMVQQCISKMREVKQSLVAIMIDIVIFETKGELDLTGIEIVKPIRIEFPNLPIFLVTKHIQGTRENAFQFLPVIVWGSLEDVDGILIKQYLCKVKEYTGLMNFRKRDFEHIINKAREKRNCYSAGSILISATDVEDKSFEELEGLFKMDGRSALQIKEIGSTVFKHLIIELFPGEIGTISYFRPGFSGSYLFRVDTHKSWILKLDETEKIEREVNNYKQIEKIIDRGNYPSLVKNSVNYGRCGAFAVAMESATITLFDYLNSSKSERISNFSEKLATILKKIYGESHKTSSHLWQEYYAFSPRTYLKIRAFFDDQKTILEKYCGKDKVNTTKAFVTSEGKSEEKIYEGVHWIYVAKTHGDLNARNILLTPDLGRIILIDYANYGPKHIIKDTAKLEADCIFSVLDATSEEFYDWNRISKWKDLFDLLRIENVFSCEQRMDIKDLQIKLMYNFVKDLRRVLKEIICTSVEAVEYLKALLYYSFHYLTYPDISIQKKVFAMEWIYQIIIQLTDTRVSK